MDLICKEISPRPNVPETKCFVQDATTAPNMQINVVTETIFGYFVLCKAGALIPYALHS